MANPPKSGPPPLPLTEEEYSRFLHLPRHLRCQEILSTVNSRLLQSQGINPDNLGYSGDIQAAATITWIAWSAARRQGGMLNGKPSYEAIETLLSRIKGSLSESADGMSWGVKLFKRLNLDLGRELRTNEIGWWQSERTNIHPSRLRSDGIRDDLTCALRLLIDQSSHIYAQEETAP